MTRPVRIPVEVGSDAWLLERRAGVTASEIATVLGISPPSWSSLFNLFHYKRSGIGGGYDSDAMAWGRELEEVILRRFAREHPELHVVPGGLYRHGERAWQMATPDGVAYDTCDEPGSGDTCHTCTCVDHRDAVAVVQVKTAASFEHWGDEGSDQIPSYYRAQVVWEMDVMGVGVAYVPVLFSGRTYREYVVEYDPDDAKLMRQAGDEFLQMLADGEEPEPDWTPPTGRTLRALHPSIEPGSVEIPAELHLEWRAADGLIKGAEKRKADAQHKILHLVGDKHQATVGNQVVATRSVYEQRRIDSDAVRAADPDLAARCSKTSTVHKLNPRRLKETTE